MTHDHIKWLRKSENAKWPYQHVALAIGRPIIVEIVYNTSVWIILIYYFCFRCNYLRFSGQQWILNVFQSSTPITNAQSELQSANRIVLWKAKKRNDRVWDIPSVERTTKRNELISRVLMLCKNVSGALWLLECTCGSVALRHHAYVPEKRQNRKLFFCIDNFLIQYTRSQLVRTTTHRSVRFHD